MTLLIINHKYQYEILKLTQIFFPNEKIDMLFSLPDNLTDDTVITTEVTENEIKVSFNSDKHNLHDECLKASTDSEELSMSSMLFKTYKQVTGYTPKWGMLTGIRPSKLLRSHQNTQGKEYAHKLFTDDFFVSDEKTALTESVAEAEEKIISLSPENSMSLYVSIPFCPSRCSYCSFVSHSMETKTAKLLVFDYINLLCKEIKNTADITKALGLKLETIYFGGGTPTTLEADELAILFDTISESFDLSCLREYTVEAGRPDTITEEKLRALRKGGVGRISINPQTFNNEVLKTIGRKHTWELTAEKFELARLLGFNNINMDLIAGLPEDSYESFCNSVEKAVLYNPENITIHTLALKRASNLGITDGRVQIEKGVLADKMLGFSYNKLTKNGYSPYYMYRQAKTIGNLENTGYCKEGFPCLYNIYMMEESHSVFSVGAGAVTKLKHPKSGEIKRIFNHKYPYEYISRFSELEERKTQILPFFENNCKK